MSDQQLSKELSAQSRRKAKGGAPISSEFAVTRGRHRDEKASAPQPLRQLLVGWV